MVKLLSEINNTYRTLLSGGIVLIVHLFALSYRKQTQYVANRVKKVNEKVDFFRMSIRTPNIHIS